MPGAEGYIVKTVDAGFTGFFPAYTLVPPNEDLRKDVTYDDDLKEAVQELNGTCP